MAMYLEGVETINEHMDNWDKITGANASDKQAGSQNYTVGQFKALVDYINLQPTDRVLIPKDIARDFYTTEQVVELAINYGKNLPKPWLNQQPSGTRLTGGPATYYDLPYREWDTTNDMGEYLAKNRWKEYSLHFKDLLKALVRFGSKDGTSMQYDIEKMIYSGCRAMIMLSGRQTLRDYLQKLLDDPQFKTKEDQ
jgi:hypothetical protein